MAIDLFPFPPMADEKLQKLHDLIEDIEKGIVTGKAPKVGEVERVEMR